MIPFRHDQKILEVGGGAAPVFHPNLDVRQLPEVDIVTDLSSKWPVADGEYDGVFSKFVIEHVSWRKVPFFVSELLRVIKPGGTACVISPNTQAQMKWALDQEDAYDKISQCLFGDLDYDENSHKAAFNPAFAIRLFREAGFESVAVLPFGELKTDMIIEARKSMNAGTANTPAPVNTPADAPVAAADKIDASKFTTEDRKRAYNRDYFNGGAGGFGGYAFEGYWDYPIHWTTLSKIMEKKPKSVLELGCSRGYTLKRLQDAGIRAQGLEISEHCFLTRVCDGVIPWDITQTPWPFKDNEFDLCFSAATLEHIPESAIDAVSKEIQRVSKRGLHGVDFGKHDDGFDKTHCLFRDENWWFKKLNSHPKEDTWMQEVVNKEDLEAGPPRLPGRDSKLKMNCGSFKTMFHQGWTNIDVHPLQQFASQHGYIYEQYDLRTGFPYKTWKADLVYACHFLEHLTYEEGAKFLKDCYGIMKPGAVLRIIIPDAKKLAQLLIDGKLSLLDQLGEDCAKATFQAKKFWEMLMVGHSSVYDAAGVATALKEAGFQKVEIQSFRKSFSPQMLAETLDVYPEISGFVEAVR